MAFCPECNFEIKDEQFCVGEVIECPECGVELEILQLDPLTFQIFEEEEK